MEFFFTGTEDLKIAGVRCCIDSEVRRDKAVVFGFVNKLDRTRLELR